MAARSDNPSDSHYACNKSRGVCTWACNSGFKVQGEVCSQTCTASADCKNAVPADSNRYCSGGFCSWRCKSGFTNTGNACVNPSTSTTTSRVASSSGASTTTSEPASSATCRVSSDCANVVPGNANRYCNGGLQEYGVDLGRHGDVNYVSPGEQLFLVSVHLVFFDLVFFDLVFFDLVFFDLDLLNLDHHNLDLLNLVLLDLVLHNLVFHNLSFLDLVLHNFVVLDHD